MYGLKILCMGVCGTRNGYIALVLRRVKLTRRRRAVRHSRIVESDSGYSRTSSLAEKESAQSENIESGMYRASQTTPKGNSKRLIDTGAVKRLAESLAKDQQNVVVMEAKMLAIESNAARLREMLRARKSSGPGRGNPKEGSTGLQKVVQKPKIRSRYKLAVSKTVQFDLDASITYEPILEKTNSVEDCRNRKGWPISMEGFDAIFH